MNGNVNRRIGLLIDVRSWRSAYYCFVLFEASIVFKWTVESRCFVFVDWGVFLGKCGLLMWRVFPF